VYKIEILDEGGTVLLLKTENRNLARAVALLCKENKLTCTVEREVKAVAVKFKNV